VGPAGADLSETTRSLLTVKEKSLDMGALLCDARTLCTLCAPNNSPELPMAHKEQGMTGENSCRCSQKAILFDAYEIATCQFTDAVEALKRQIGISGRAQYMTAYKAVESLRQDAVMLREELEWHVKQHGC
jgi:hypothetical protein